MNMDKTNTTVPPAVHRYLSEIGARGGASRSPAKVAAVSAAAKRRWALWRMNRAASGATPDSGEKPGQS